jgi:5-methylcytosine-specific restriction endonuclease McrA
MSASLRYYYRNQEAQQETARKWKINNKERNLATGRDYRRLERQNSPGKVGTWRTNARLKKLGLPVTKWTEYSRTDQQFFQVAYQKARDTGNVVDHIVSLQDGGLHTWDNVQVISKWENDFKG